MTKPTAHEIIAKINAKIKADPVLMSLHGERMRRDAMIVNHAWMAMFEHCVTDRLIQAGLVLDVDFMDEGWDEIAERHVYHPLNETARTFMKLLGEEA